MDVCPVTIEEAHKVLYKYDIGIFTECAGNCCGQKRWRCGEPNLPPGMYNVEDIQKYMGGRSITLFPDEY